MKLNKTINPFFISGLTGKVTVPIFVVYFFNLDLIKKIKTNLSRFFDSKKRGPLPLPLAPCRGGQKEAVYNFIYRQSYWFDLKNGSIKAFRYISGYYLQWSFTRLLKNWNIIVDNTKVVINAVAAAVNFVSYTLVLKGYMKYVHNIPYDTHPGAPSINLQKKVRNRLLTGFLGFVMLGLMLTAINTKDIFTLEVHNSKEDSTMLGLMGWISNKIPSGFKFGFKLVFIVVLVLKVLGFSLYTDFYLNMHNFKLLNQTLCVLWILYLLLHIYLIHKFAQKDRQVPQILPEFLIEWLSEFKEIVATPQSIKSVKNMYYIQIVLYICIIVFTILVY